MKYSSRNPGDTITTQISRRNLLTVPMGFYFLPTRISSSPICRGAGLRCVPAQHLRYLRSMARTVLNASKLPRYPASRHALVCLPDRIFETRELKCQSQ